MELSKEKSPIKSQPKTGAEAEKSHIKFQIATCKYGDAIKGCEIAQNNFPLFAQDFLYLKAEALESQGNLQDAFKILCELKEKGYKADFLLERIEKILKDPENNDVPMIPQEEKDLYDIFTKWMKEKGAEFGKIELKYFYKDYRGVMATDDINENEVIISVPISIMITLEMAREASIGKQCLEKHANLIYPNNSLLSTFVLSEKANPGSPWSLFFKTLPQSVDNFPIFYNKAERNLLEGSNFLLDIKELKHDMEYDYKQICNAAPEFANIASLEDFMKTRSLVNSRIFGTKIDGKDIDSIVPFADMFNFKYQTDMTNWAYNEETKEFQVLAKQKISKGEEIFVYYGDKPNANFLQFYGFLLEGNELDQVIFEIELNKSDPLYSLKKGLLDVVKAKNFKLKLTTSAENESFGKTISFMRYLAYNGPAEILKQIKEKCDKNQEINNDTVCFKAKKIPPLSIDNEILALQILKNECYTRLNKYPQPIEYDEEALKKSKILTFNQKNCLLLRLSEKKILKYYIEISDQAIDALKFKSKEMLKKISQNLKNTQSYMQSLEMLL